MTGPTRVSIPADPAVVSFTRAIPGYVVAFDPGHPDRDKWEGTDLAFERRDAAEHVLAGRVASWPDLPFRLYALVQLPDFRDGLTVTGVRAHVDAERTAPGDAS